MSDPARRIDLRTDHLALIRNILRKHIPDREVVVFGSRATWTAREYSDLDLAVCGSKPLTVDTRSALAEELGESDLPFKVDIVDWARIDGSFRDIIRRDGIALNLSG